MMTPIRLANPTVKPTFGNTFSNPQIEELRSAFAKKLTDSLDYAFTQPEYENYDASIAEETNKTTHKAAIIRAAGQMLSNGLI